jgi:hypothetical protein
LVPHPQQTHQNHTLFTPIYGAHKLQIFPFLINLLAKQTPKKKKKKKKKPKKKKKKKKKPKKLKKPQKKPKKFNFLMSCNEQTNKIWFNMALFH